MIRTSILTLLGVTLLSVGCVRAPGGMAPSNIPLDQGGYKVLGQVSAADCKYNLLGLIPISGGNQLSDALDEAQGDIAGADALIDITVEAVSKYFILWSQGCTVVRATAVSVN